MNTDKLIDMMKMGSLTLPMYLIKNYQKLGIDINDLIILAYLINNNSLFDYNKISNDLNLEQKLVLESINNLQEKGLISISVKKNGKGIVEECLSLDPLYHKLSLMFIEGVAEPKETNNIYVTFEKELGRTLSPMEYEIITGWLESKYSEDLIIGALKEAVYNGANNLRYIDKILFEWRKKGIKNPDDVKKEREKFVKAKQEKIAIEDYNWLEDEE